MGRGGASAGREEPTKAVEEDDGEEEEISQEAGGPEEARRRGFAGERGGGGLEFLDGEGPVAEAGAPFRRDGLRAEGGAGDTADDGGDGIGIAAAIQRGGEGGGEIVRMTQPRIEGDGNGVEGVTGDTAGEAEGTGVFMRLCGRGEVGAEKRDGVLPVGCGAEFGKGQEEVFPAFAIG